jgi:hypothetical protein
VQTAIEGDVICDTQVDRRGRLLATAIGSYTIFTRRRA